MNRSRRLAIPTALLALAQLLVPSFGVVHAHDAGGVALGARAAERHTVHAHGAGLPHDHSSGSMGDRPAGSDDSPVGAGYEGTGFRRLGAPAAALRVSSADWIRAWEEAAVPPETSMGGAWRGAAPIATLVFRPHPRGPDRSLGSPLELPRAAWPQRRLLGTRPLRGPPRCV